MLRRFMVALFSLGLPSLAVFPLAAAGARNSGAKGADAGGTYDPNNVTAISKYMETLSQGNAKLSAQDVQGAVELYKQAIPLAPKNPLGHYFLGEAQLASGSLSDADTAFRRAEELSDDHNPNLRAKILFVLADLLERQKKWAEAKKAWQTYQEYASKFADAGTWPQSGATRVLALEGMLTQEKGYEGVRQRIVMEREAGAAPKKK